MKLSSISFFCPALNEEENLSRLIPRAQEVLADIADQYEIIVIDDGSTDRTRAVAERYAQEDPHVRVIHHPTNQGYGASLAEGFRGAKYDWIMYTDADYQYDIGEVIPHLHLLGTHDIISGYVTKKAASWYRVLQSGVYNGLVRLLFGHRIRDINCAMKIYARDVIRAIDIRSNSFFVDAEMLIRASRQGYRIAQYPVTHLPRATGVATGSRAFPVMQTIREMLRFRIGLL